MGRIPLMGVPVVLYTLIAFGLMTTQGAGDGSALALSHAWFTLPMPITNSQWIISLGDVVLSVGLSCLFVEILKSTRTSDTSITNHVLGMLVLIVAIGEFLLFAPFATSTFFLLTVMCGLDVLAGFIVTTVGARKDIGI